MHLHFEVGSENTNRMKLPIKQRWRGFFWGRDSWVPSTLECKMSALNLTHTRLFFLFFSFLFFLGGFFFCIHDLRMNSVVKRNATDTSGMQSNHCFCQGVQVHVRMCLSAKQLKSLHGRLKQWKHWLWLSRRSQHPAEVISIPMDTQGLAPRIHLTRCYLKSRNTANLSQ